MNIDLNNAIVQKRWGYEYLAYRNQNLAIWYLYIKTNESTSLHCHCDKNTGLIVLDGIAKISFLNNSLSLKGLDKIQIFKGRFHATRALSKFGCHILEIEAPEDKTDLVRLSDDYGRENEEYEDNRHYGPKTDDCINLNTHCSASKFGCLMSVQNIQDKHELMNRPFDEVNVILKGGIAETKHHRIISGCGDVVASHNFDILLKKFDIIQGTQILSIKKYALVTQ